MVQKGVFIVFAVCSAELNIGGRASVSGQAG